eukprot:CAMPEP_0195517630 /NCGR_PEP_ID=MMETSP0794_2-20130614/11096_1 /TAXON_ID=515487 /ORGANISM="Stephanopyxis turris, Strain CCMP 815" /LENGTH=1723 /DNA_ID=CAMNT_0040646463 /DNA_START=75 /DNA_END=5246 /DNA_ORIENTATION=+
MKLVASRQGLLHLVAHSLLCRVFANQDIATLDVTQPLFTEKEFKKSDLKIENDGNGITRHLLSSLSCNENLPEVCTTKYSELVDKSVIPCGECVYIDESGPTLSLNGLNIIGKLVFDERSTPISITTPFVYVQGELEIKSNGVLSPANEAVRFVLTGTERQFLTPEGGGVAIDAGKKPFLVAGGKLSISAIPDHCPTWTKLKKIELGDREHLSEGMYPEIVHAPATCDSTGDSKILFHHKFDGMETTEWTGNKGAYVDIAADGFEDETSVLRVTKRKRPFQGPLLDTTKYVPCLIPDVDYLFTAKIKLAKGDETGPTTCKQKNTNCLKFFNYIKHVDDLGRAGDRYQNQNQHSAGNYGDWIHFTATFRYTESDLEPQNIVYHMMQIVGPEEGVDIIMGEATLSLPDETSYPEPENVCQNLILNGNAEGNQMHPYPMKVRSAYTSRLVVKEEESGNKYYSQVGRNFAENGIIVKGLNPYCMKANLLYRMSMQTRIHSTTKVRYWAELKSFNADDSYRYSYPVQCDPQDLNDGWVTCSGNFMITEAIESAVRHELRIEFEDTVDGKDADVDYDNISLTFEKGPVKGLILDKDVADCWGPGSDVLITSHTLSYDEQQEGVIASVTRKTDDTSLLSLEGSILPATSEFESSDFAAEVAILTRNVIIEGAKDDETNEGKHGGYLSVHNTRTEQLIEGVDLRYMGQQGLQHRYPIEFFNCGDVPGSKVSKNTIRDSYQRCVVVRNTNSLRISQNVAYHTAGHCYVIADGGEVNNLFEKNLGAWSYKSNFPITGETGNGHASTFLILNPNNHLIGNVAAGAYYAGFWFPLKVYVQRDSKILHPSVRPRSEDLGTFEDNVSHSNRYYGVRINDYTPRVMHAFANMKSYLNRNAGFYFYASRNVALKGSLFADNRKGVLFDYTDNVKFHDSIIRGQTLLYKNLAETQNLETLCPSKYPVVGLAMPTFLRYSNKLGAEFSNLHFTEFDNSEGCHANSGPIFFNSRRRDRHWNYLTSFQNVTIDESSDLNLRTAEIRDVTDVVITDLDSSTNPDILSKFSGSSSIVSNKSYMTGLFPERCTNYGGNYFSYCEDTCLRTVYFFVESYGTELWTLIVTKADGSLRIEVPGNYESTDKTKDIHNFRRLRRFSASLPEGKYTAEFHDESGNQAWPTFAEEFWERKPACAGSAEVGSVTFLEVGTHNCDLLIRNSDMETIEPYYHNGGDIEHVPQGGIGGTGALKTKSRSRYYHGIGQYLDTRCFRENIGKQYEVTASYQVLDGSGNTIQCDPNKADFVTGCPVVQLVGRYYKDETRLESKNTYPHIGHSVQAHNQNGFNQIHGVFTITEHLASMQSIWLYLQRTNDKWEIIVSDISVSRFSNDISSWCDELVTNGDFKTGTAKYWDTFPYTYSASAPYLEVVTGYDGEGDYALKAYKRSRTNSSPRQDVKLGCMFDGDRYRATAKYKLEKDGNIFTCNPHTSNTSTRCPEMMIKAQKSGVSSSYTYIPYATQPVSSTTWSYIEGVFKVKQPAEVAEQLIVYFEDEDISLDITVDNVSITPLPMDCTSLILNPTFEEGRSGFWLDDSRDNSKLDIYSPGAHGSIYAMRSYARTHRDRGPRQYLDDRCFVSGATFIITAQFKLLHADNNDNGVVCAPTSRSSTDGCPSVSIYGQTCDSGSEWNRRWNELPLTWDSAGYNEYQAEFTVSPNLATCTDVEVRINYIHESIDIVVDNINIKAK